MRAMRSDPTGPCAPGVAAVGVCRRRRDETCWTQDSTVPTRCLGVLGSNRGTDDWVAFEDGLKVIEVLTSRRRRGRSTRGYGCSRHASMPAMRPLMPRGDGAGLEPGEVFDRLGTDGAPSGRRLCRGATARASPAARDKRRLEVCPYACPI